MAKAYDARCLVLKHTKLGETDVIVTLLAQDGHQIRAVAKGLRKPGNRIGARLETFAEVDALFHEGKSLDIVREVKTVRTNAGIRDDLQRVACANVAAEFLEKLGRDGAPLGPRLFGMSAACFAHLSDSPASMSALILSAFLMKAMSMQGFGPAVRECAICGEPVGEGHAFDVSHGGAVCASCMSSMGIALKLDEWRREWVESLVYCTFDELMDLEDYPAQELLDLSHAWVREHADLNLKSFAFLRTIML